MSGAGIRAAVAEIAAGQWGLLTTAQATAAGVSRMMLSRMAERGELERITHGVYATPAGAGDELSEKRAAWLSIEPNRLAYERLAESPPTGVLSHATAAGLHQAGDLLEAQVEVTLPTRYRARRPEVRAHRGTLRSDEVTLVDGLPVTTPARTVADLLADGHDRDHVATVVADMLKRSIVTVSELESALGSVERDRSGPEVVADLLEIAGIDEDHLVQQLVTSSLGASAVSSAAARVLQMLAESSSGDNGSGVAAHYSRALQRSGVQKWLRDDRAVVDVVKQINASSALPALSLPETSKAISRTAAASLPPGVLAATVEAWRKLALAQQVSTDDTRSRDGSDEGSPAS
ncbi:MULTISPECIES: type IV toxin-antitoxin system AbiEi family antitoxin domain-containing protein [Isoptericola]|uniref:type IV toxin-antitoxin system AbiEi family antitoxin domain-containing protein n=1 Tax=Isoptericola TaxID=254250 RepID=UPI00383AC787